MVKIPIIKPEEMSYTELSEFSEDIEKEEKRRRKLERNYAFTEEDIKELNRRLADGEDIEDVTKSISEKGTASQLTPLVKLPIHIPIQPVKPPVQTPTRPAKLSEQFVQPPALPTPSHVLELAKKKEKKALKSDVHRIDHPAGECCTNVCNLLNDAIDGYTGIVSPNKDTKIKFNTLVELRRQFYIQDACQCANGVYAQRYDIPLKEKQTENCCPKVCNVLNNSIDEYEGVLFPSHNIVLTSDTLYDMRSRIYKNGGCRCVESEELLKRQPRGGPAIDPLLQIKMGKLLKFAESQGWI